MQDEAGRDDATISLRVSTVSAMVAAFVGNNHVTLEQIPQVVAAFTAEADKLIGGTTVEAAPAEPDKVQPFTTVRKSITPDYLISLFDGKKFKSLKRYLATSHNMTPAEYRAYFNLPKDYPMVAPNYAAHRSELAKRIGLGKGGRGGAAGSTASASETSAAPKAPKAPKTPKASTAKAAAPKAGKAKAAPKAKAPTKADLNKMGVGGGDATNADIKAVEA